MKDNNVKCPSCQKVFKLDDSVYVDIVKQVRDQQFQNDLSNRIKSFENEHDLKSKIKESELNSVFEKQLSDKQRKIDELKFKSESELAGVVSKKNQEIIQLQSKIDKINTEKKLELQNTLNALEMKNNQLVNDLKLKEAEKENLATSLKEDFRRELDHVAKDITLKDQEIERLKDFKQRLSTKMIGETLEQHCENEFNKLRATAFQNAYFDKDNDISQGTKGDYIYKEYDDSGNEIISIMFEMKNENENTITKKKNEEFFSKLDKDRRDKKCEYSVLVSLLERDNELYNTGIVDVSYKYPKMYVIRPQFFIPIITLLRNAGMKSLEYKKELNIMKNQNIDITNFEEKINNFREGFAKNYVSASSHFEKAIEEIDKSIKKMENVKSELKTTANQLRLANNKADDLTIKKLTYGNSTMKEKFKSIKNK